METKTLGHLTYRDGTYQTSATSLSFAAKAFPSLTFYAKLIAIVYAGSRKAKRGQYPKTQWVLSSSDVIRALESIGLRIDIRGIEHLQAVEGG